MVQNPNLFEVIHETKFLFYVFILFSDNKHHWKSPQKCKYRCQQSRQQIPTAIMSKLNSLVILILEFELRATFSFAISIVSDLPYIHIFVKKVINLV